MALALVAAYLSARRDRSSTPVDGSHGPVGSTGAGAAGPGQAIPPEPPSGEARRLGEAMA